MPKDLLRPGIRACGIATPEPTPVDPSCSRLMISVEIRDGSTATSNAARVESSLRSTTLSDARTSTMTSFSARKALISIALPM
jgi:hypothetical protein